MEAQLRSYLNDHATAWWAYMKKGEWAEQIGSFTRDALYITIMFILIPTAALILYSLLVIGRFLGKGFNLLAEREKDKKSFFTLMSQWFNGQNSNVSVNQTIQEPLAETIQDNVEACSLQMDSEDTLTTDSNVSNTYNSAVDKSKSSEGTSLNKEVGLYQTTLVSSGEPELYGAFSSSSTVYSTNKLEEDSPF